MIHICPQSTTPVCRAESSHALEELRRQLEARSVCPMSTPHVLPGSFCDIPRGQTADNNCQTVFGRSRDNGDGDGREQAAGWLVGFRMGQTHFAGVTGTKARAMSLLLHDLVVSSLRAGFFLASGPVSNFIVGL